MQHSPFQISDVFVAEIDLHWMKSNTLDKKLGSIAVTQNKLTMGLETTDQWVEYRKMIIKEDKQV